MKAFNVILIFAFLFSNLLFSQPEWQQLNSGTSNYLLDLHFISENTGWVVGYGGVILKTTNGGDNWVQQSSGTSTNLRSVFFLNDQLGWVGGYNGIILKTTNGGDSWESSQHGFGDEDVYELSFLDESIGFALIGKVSPYYYAYILKTTSGGSSWQMKSSIYDDAYLDLFSIREYAWVVGTGVTSYSTNSGEYWEFVYPNTGQWLYDVFFFDETIGWAVGGGTDSEIILKSGNGGNSWQIMQESFQHQRLHGVTFTDLNKGWTVGENGVILRTTNGGVSWSEFNSPTNSFLREIQFPSQAVGYIVGQNGTILKYSDYSNLINILNPNGGEIITAGSTYYIEWNSQNVINVKIEYSTDNGMNWEMVVNSTPSTGIYEWTVPATLTTQGRVRISDVNDPSIFDISDGSFTIQSSKVITVIAPNGGEEIDGGTYYEIQWISNDVEFVKLEYSINNGASWNLIADSIPATGAYLWSVPNILTIQGRIKISDITLPTIYDVNDNPFRINYVVSVDDPDNLISQYSLMQNYPNPFNPSTLIQYSIPEYSFVSIEIYDVLGNLIKSLVSEELAAGDYSIEFEAVNIPSGIYFYKLQANNFVACKKMILLK